MHRFYAPPEACRHPTIQLSERESHHAQSVLRSRMGERVIVLDGEGQEYLCEVTHVGHDAVKLAVNHQNRIAALPRQVVLIQAMTKGRTMDLIMQKATELGAHRVVPLQSDRSVVQFNEEEGAQARVEHWRQTAIEAIKQCGSAWLPVIEPPRRVSEFLAQSEKFDLALLATLQSDAEHPRACLDAFANEHGSAPRSVAVWVGPEGDFTPAEINSIRNAGARPITLGPLVLRSETAAIYCLSVLNYELQTR